MEIQKSSPLSSSPPIVDPNQSHQNQSAPVNTSIAKTDAAGLNALTTNNQFGSPKESLLPGRVSVTDSTDPNTEIFSQTVAGAGAASAPPPSAPPVVQPKPVLTTQEKAVEIAKISQMAANPDAAKSTQASLKELVDGLTALGYTVEIESKLNGEPGPPQVEAFSVDSLPNNTYYKVGATYQLKATMAGQPDVLIPPMAREIFTTSKTPEGAIFAANNYKETIEKLALGKLENITDEGKKKDVMAQRSFEFKYDYSSEGTPSKFRSVHASDKDKTQLIFTPDHIESNYIYYRDANNQLHRLAKDKQTRLKGKTIFATKEEALAKTSYQLNDPDLYARLEKSKDIADVVKQLQEIKQEILKRESEFAGIKAEFDGVAFKQMQADLAYDGDSPFIAKDHSPAMQQLQLKEKELIDLLYQLGGENQVQADLEKLEQMKNPPQEPAALKALKDEIRAVMNRIKQNHPENEVLNPVVRGADEIPLPQIDIENNGEMVQACIELRKGDAEKIANIDKEIKGFENTISDQQREFNNKLSDLQRVNASLKHGLDRLTKLSDGAKGRLEEKLGGTAITQPQEQAAQFFQASIPDNDIQKLTAEIASNDQLIAELTKKLS